MLRFLDIFWIDKNQFLPAGVVGYGNAHDMIGVAFGERKHFELHPFQFFKSQVLEQRAPGRREIMLDWISEGEEIASGFLETVAQRDQLLPTIDRNDPAIVQFAAQLFRFDAKIDNIAIGPYEWMERLDVGDCRSILFPAINFDRSRFAQLDRNDPRRRINTEEHRVLFEFH